MGIALPRVSAKSIAAALAALLAIAPAAAAPFNGPYVGATAGWNRDELSGRTVGGTDLDNRLAQDSVLLGAYAGYNKTLGMFVLGAEVGVSGTIEDEVGGRSLNRDLEYNPLYSFDISARAGVLATDRTLIYARGGYANTRARVTVADPGGPISTSDNLDGWQVGGGVERALTDHISARLEYRYSDFGTGGGTHDRHQALVGVSYNF